MPVEGEVSHEDRAFSCCILVKVTTGYWIKFSARSSCTATVWLKIGLDRVLASGLFGVLQSELHDRLFSTDLLLNLPPPPPRQDPPDRADTLIYLNKLCGIRSIRKKCSLVWTLLTNAAFVKRSKSCLLKTICPQIRVKLDIILNIIIK